MRPLSDFYDHLLPHLPGATTPLVDLHLREAAREFCDTGLAWVIDYDPINTVGGRSTYDLSPSEPQSEAVKVRRLTVNGVLLYDDLARERSTSSTNDAEPRYPRDRPPFTVSLDRTEITLTALETPTAGQAGGMVITGAVKPKHDATQLPDFLRLVFRDAIVCGTLARMMVLPKKPWTDYALGSAHQSRFNKEMADARYQAAVGNTRRPLRARPWG